MAANWAKCPLGRVVLVALTIVGAVVIFQAQATGKQAGATIGEVRQIHEKQGADHDMLVTVTAQLKNINDQLAELRKRLDLRDELNSLSALIEGMKRDAKALPSRPAQPSP